MKRFAAIFILLLTVSMFTSTAAFAAEYRETPIDQAGDWFATLGKQGMEKDRILAERKAERMAKYTEREAKKAAKEAEKAAQDAKKKMGL